MRRFLGLAVVMLTSCQAGAPVLPPAPPAVNITMREYRFDYPKAIPRGRVVFHIQNAGNIPHRLALIPLAEDFPPIDAQIRGSERRTIAEVAGIPNRAPGEAGGFAVDLEPGRYAFVCLLVDPDRQSHAFKGMASEFRVKSSS